MPTVFSSLILCTLAATAQAQLQAVPLGNERQNARNIPTAIIPSNPRSHQADLDARPVEQAPAAPQRALTPKEIELLQTKGIVAFNRGQYGEAHRLLMQVYSANPRAYVALEYLAKIADLRQDYQEAIKIYRIEQKVAPRDRIGATNFFIGDEFMKMQREAQAERFMRAAVEQGAYPIQANYYLGYILYRQEHFREAERYLHECKKLIEQAGSKAADESLLQPLHYYLGEIYVRLGYPRYSLYELYTGALGTNQPIKRAAWTLEEALDQPTHTISGGLYFQYDSNATQLATSATDPNLISNKGGFGQTYLISIAAQSSPSRKWSYGGDYNFVFNHHNNAALAAVDFISNSPGVWGSWWNSRDMEVRLRYDYTHILANSALWKLFSQSQGPTLSWSYFWDRRRQLDLSYSYKRNFYPDEGAIIQDLRTGEQHTATIKGSFSAPNPDFLPYALYSYSENQTEGVEYYAVSHTLELGTGYMVGDFARATAGFSYALSNYPRSIGARQEQTRIFKFGFQMPFASNFLTSLDGSFTDNKSTSPAIFSYQRFQLNLGVVYTLPF